jgi:tRNA (cmo5U34)-methyltransferase
MDSDWTEELSEGFLEYGRYFVPEREEQIEALCSLTPEVGRKGTVIDLCCGEGLLSAALLERYPECQVLGLDGSPAMLTRARQTCSASGNRFKTQLINLSAGDWRLRELQPGAILSSLAIHHLDGPGKRQLFKDCFNMLQPGGGLLIADLIEPASQPANAYAAQRYDEAVRLRSLDIDGHLAMYERMLTLQWNIFRYPDEMDRPSPLYAQQCWLDEAGFQGIDVFWLKAGHAIYGGYRPG